ncbi:hypothetical protein LSCM1_00630 [Leishmania martiniquensis]|uniref:Uncharacterized protein n=1 Tax=Leishmania martiniquensis TaxID=1580590 RepID=A0A836GUN5_9TRYP|nr:hypothetical protein LSCM1_00630 [Leishmania martiniquensis]
MSEAEHSRVSSAALRFYAAQRLERAWELPVGLVPRPGVVHSDPLAPRDTVQATLEAFMNSREENAVSFVASFLQLTQDDRVTALARLEDEEGTRSAFSTIAAKERSDPSKLAVAVAELRQRLQGHEVRAEQCALAERQPSSTAPRNAEGPYSVIHQRPFNKGHRLCDGTASAETVEAQSAAAWNGGEEEVETIALEEGTRTGSLLAFLRTGAMDVPTSFDNFFDTAAAPRAAMGNLPEKARDLLSVHPAPGTLPTLDSILGLDTEEPVDPTAPSCEKMCCWRTTAASEIDVTLHAPEQRPLRRGGSTVSSLTSSAESVELPGLEDASLSKDAHGKASLSAYRTDVFAQMQEVIEYCDSCVEAFVLDPLFDYDADLLGEAFCSGARWRQE